MYAKRLVLFMSLFLLLSKEKSWSDDFADIPKLNVRGEASIFKPSDQMEVSLGIITTAESSSIALNENNQRMHQIIANLQMLGLDEKDYQMGHFHIRPIYQKPPKDSQESEYAKISHYEVENAIQVKTQKIALADKVIAAAVQGGANHIDQINFSIYNPQVHRAEAIQAAAQNAIADASALANALGLKLKRVIHVTLDHWQQFPRPMMLSKRSEVGSYEATSSETMEPGKAEIHANVSVIFEIGS